MRTKRHKAKVRIAKLLYELLSLPFDDSIFNSNCPKDYIHAGTFSPLKVVGGIEEICEYYCRFARRFDGLEIQSKNIIYRSIKIRKWITFNEYKRLFKQNKEYVKLTSQAELIIKDESRETKMKMLNDRDPFKAIDLADTYITLLKRHFNKIDTPDIDSYIQFILENDLPVAKLIRMEIPLFISEKIRKLHSYISGASGSGKSELIKALVWEYIIRDQAAVIVIDPSGKLSLEIARFKEFRPGSPFADKLVYIDLFLGEKQGLMPVLNPFEIHGAKTEKIIDSVTQELTGGFEQLLKGTTFTAQMETLLHPCIATLLRMNKDTTLFDLQDFMENDEYLISQGLKTPNKGHRRFFSKRFVKTDYDITKSSIFTKMQFLSGKTAFSNFVCGKSTIDLESLINDKKIILFNLSSGDLGPDVSSAIGSLVAALTQSNAHRRTASFGNYVPIHLIVDECQNYISSSIKKVVTESRKFQLHLTLASQIIGQDMDSRLKNIIVENTALKIQGMGTEEPFNALNPGEYYLTTKNGKKVVFNGDASLLDNKNSMSTNEWGQVRAKQLELYYRPLNPEEEKGEYESLQDIDETRFVDKGIIEDFI